MLVRVLWAGRYGRGAVDRSDALAAEVLVRALLARVLLCVLLVIGRGAALDRATMMLLLADVIYSLLKMNAAPLPELMIWLCHRDRGGE